MHSRSRLFDTWSKITTVSMTTCEGSNISRPPLIEGHNYGYWKAKMRAFLMSVDELVWLAVEKERKAPTDRGTY